MYLFNSSAFSTVILLSFKSLIFPARTDLLSIVDDTPLPTVIKKFSHFKISFPVISLYEFTIAFPIGCSESASQAAANEKIFSSVKSFDILLYSLTVSLPVVSVPVLSKAIVSTFESLSKASPSLT